MSSAVFVSGNGCCRALKATHADICRSNAITSEIVEKYALEVYDKLYPV